MEAVERLVNHYAFQRLGVFAEADQLVFAAFEVLEIAVVVEAALFQHPFPLRFVLDWVFAAGLHHIFHNLLHQRFRQGGVDGLRFIFYAVDGPLQRSDVVVDGGGRRLPVVVRFRRHAAVLRVPGLGRDAVSQCGLEPVAIERPGHPDGGLVMLVQPFLQIEFDGHARRFHKGKNLRPFLQAPHGVL